MKSAARSGTPLVEVPEADDTAEKQCD